MSMKLVAEDLRERFGRIYLEIFEQDRTSRLSALRRKSDGAILTYHIVTFNLLGISALGNVHEKIISGGSMGDIIKKSGIKHERVVSKPYARTIPAHVKSIFNTKRRKCREEIIVYKIKGSPYARIRELYNPEFTAVPVRAKSSRERHRITQTAA